MHKVLNEYSSSNVAKFNNLNIHIQQLIFMFSKIYLYSTFYIYIQQYAFSVNFNPNYFHSTKIFVQLQPKIISFNKNNYSTSTKNNFIQQQSSQTFKISSFTKIPRPSPVKYKTTLSHASNISQPLPAFLTFCSRPTPSRDIPLAIVFSR